MAAAVALLAIGLAAPRLVVDVAEPPPPGQRVELTGGLHVNLFDEGSGPPVVLVHGLPGSAYEWSPLPEALVNSGYRVVRYDRVGYGHSDRRSADADHTFAVNADELLGLVDALGLERPTVVGWSYGGGIAQRAAALAPDRIGRLVLLASVGPLHPWAEPGHAARLFLSGPLVRIAFATRWARPAIARHLSLVFAPHPVPERWPDHVYALLAMPGAAHTWAMELAHYRPELLIAERVRVPTLVVHGERDRLVPQTVAEDLATRIPGARLVLIASGGHMLPVTHGHWIAERLRGFVAATPVDAAAPM